MKKIYEISIPEDRDKKYQRFTYPGGESQVRLLDAWLPIQDQIHMEIQITARITSAEHIMELVLLCSALDISMHCYKTLVIPYLPYGRADRPFVEGDCFGLRAFGGIIDSLDFDRVITIDAHSDEAKHEIRNLVNLSPKEAIGSVLSVLGWQQTTVILPDAGASRYSLWKMDGFNTIQAEKHRDPSTGHITSFTLPDIPTNKALVIDDICDGGATFLALAKAANMAQDKELYLYVTHGIFSKGFSELKKYYKGFYCLDTFSTWPAKPEETSDLRLSVLPYKRLLNSLQ